MPTPSYIAITDTEILPGKPTKTSLFSRLRDNVLSIIGGGSGAPLIERLAIAASGADIDGGWVNGTSIAGLGFFEPSSIVFSGARSLPGITIARVSGDVTISAAVTLDTLTAAEAAGAALHLRAVRGSDGGAATINDGGGGGGANVGDGAIGGTTGGGGVAGPGGTGYSVAGLERDYLALFPRLGGIGGDGLGTGVGGSGAGGNAGGCLILLVEGDVDLSGGTLSVDGGAGAAGAGGLPGGGGGGAGGTIIIIATGTITGGTYNANGGAGGGSAGGRKGGGGGGGRIALVASAFAGSRTKNVAGGAGNATGSSGTATEYTFTAAQIRALLFRSY